MLSKLNPDLEIGSLIVNGTVTAQGNVSIAANTWLSPGSSATAVASKWATPSPSRTVA
ncbi:MULTISPECIES: hypothetical protein [Streptomyces]|uniref:hypothetical protein n=1 Tax=Streptomyces TaxID=1883 RepID=UPI00226E0EAC|nr:MULTISPECIES: hypothetical protein [unclassified Streptomyces]MCY0944793.1 hypothetical protein [Streptomyces sp. H34-AA3]MCY0962198.1 hypothetical protein [Streptomyces sp. H27-H5]MCZ4081173.1 hypothetical protein [Streptomyces sp. H34-S5]